MKPYIKFYFMLMSMMCILSLGAQTPVAQYSFTSNANDQSANANHAVVNGALLTQDRFGAANKAMSFDGLQSAITAKNIPALNTPNITISFWVKVNQLPGQGEVFLLSNGGWQEPVSYTHLAFIFH